MVQARRNTLHIQGRPLGEMGDPYLQEIEQKFLCALKEIMPFQILNVIYRNAKHH